MNIRSKKLLIATCAITAWMCVVVADATAGVVNVDATVGGGLAIPVGDLGDFYDAGPNVQASLHVSSSTFPVGARVRGLWFKLKEPGSLLGPPKFEGSFSAYGAIAEAVLQPHFGSPLVPYIFGGYGVLSMKAEHTDNSMGTSTSARDSKGVLSAGGGLQLMWESWGLYSEAAYLRIDSGNAEVTQFGAGAVLKLK